VVEIHGAPGVDVLGSDALALTRDPDGTIRIPVGDLYAGQRQSLALPVKVPTGGRLDVEQLLGQVRLSYRPTAASGSVVSQLDVRYRLTASSAQTEKGERPEIMVAADRMRIAHALS